MNRVIFDNESFTITKFIKTNSEHSVFEYNGLKYSEQTCTQERVTILFVKKNDANIQEYIQNGQLYKICSLPSDYSDDKFHRKFRTNNVDFDLYLFYEDDEGSNDIIEPREVVEKEITIQSENRSKIKAKYVKFFLFLVTLVLISLTFLFIYDKIYSKNNDYISDETTSSTAVTKTNVESTSVTDVNIESTSLSNSEDEFVLGDLNGDGKVTNEDYELIREYGKKDDLPKELFDIADINEDGLFNTNDVVEFRKKFPKECNQ